DHLRRRRTAALLEALRACGRLPEWPIALARLGSDAIVRRVDWPARPRTHRRRRTAIMRAPLRSSQTRADRERIPSDNMITMSMTPPQCWDWATICALYPDRC